MLSISVGVKMKIGKRPYNDLADKPTDMIRVECQRDLFWVSTC